MKLNKKNYKYWKKAKKIIPGGNMLFSKRPDLFLPIFWPTYFETSKGCKIVDLSGNSYLDFSLMGVGTNILGYGNTKVDSAVKKAIQKGNMSTLNCYEEVLLAEKLITLHPWAEMVKFARTGGEANAVAIRIARAASGKDKVAICGYHGWHDWYLAANLDSSKKLENHLLAGLEINGVPKSLKKTTFTFNYNDFDGLQKLIYKNPEIGVVKMEVSRNFEPKDNFLSKVRKLCDKNNIVLIFDECTSGFRETYGGLHLKYGIEPDIAIFGKALGNGYAITSIIGRRNVMENAQSTFISSTFWSERIGFSAGLKTLEVMNLEKSWKKISKVGVEIKKNWEKISQRYNIKIEITGLQSIPAFKFLKNNRELSTFVTQEMLKKGFIASNTIFVSLAHKSNLLKKYFMSLEEVFNQIQIYNNKGVDIKKKIAGPLKSEGFKRLN